MLQNIITHTRKSRDNGYIYVVECISRYAAAGWNFKAQNSLALTLQNPSFHLQKMTFQII